MERIVLKTSQKTKTEITEGERDNLFTTHTGTKCVLDRERVDALLMARTITFTKIT